MEKKWIPSAEGKVANLALPLSLEATLCEQRNILDHQTDSQATDDVVVEVLVSGKTEHESLTRIGMSGE